MQFLLKACKKMIGQSRHEEINGQSRHEEINYPKYFKNV